MIVRSPDTSTIIGLEVGVIRRLPLLDDIDLGHVLGGVHDEVTGEILGPGDTKRGVGEVTVGVEANEVRIVPAIPVDAVDEEVIALSGGDTQHVCPLLLDVGSIVHDDVHVVRVNVNHGRGKGREVDETDAVGLALGEVVNVGILAFVYNDAVREWWSELDIAWLQHVSHKIKTLAVVPGCGGQIYPNRTEEVVTYQSETVKMTSSSYLSA